MRKLGEQGGDDSSSGSGIVWQRGKGNYESDETFLSLIAKINAYRAVTTILEQLGL